jgi:hypothetical protein
MTRRRSIIQLCSGLTVSSDLLLHAQSFPTHQENIKLRHTMPHQIVVVSPTPLPPGLIIPPSSVIDARRAEVELDSHEKAGFTITSTASAAALVKNNAGEFLELPVVVYTLKK